MERNFLYSVESSLSVTLFLLQTIQLSMSSDDFTIWCLESFASIEVTQKFASESAAATGLSFDFGTRQLILILQVSINVSDSSGRYYHHCTNNDQIKLLIGETELLHQATGMIGSKIGSEASS